MNRKTIREEARKIRDTAGRINSILREEKDRARMHQDPAYAEACAREAIKLEAESLMFRLNGILRALQASEGDR